VLDACLEQDPYSRVACETATKTGFVMLLGEITTRAHLNFDELARKVILDIGYDNSLKGFDGLTCAVQVAIARQSGDIAMGVDKSLEAKTGEMSDAEIRSMVGEFADASLRATAAGFDAIQIHAAHGYLVSEFLSPFFNKRTDAYGGPVKNRAKFLLDIVHAMRRKVGDTFPILVKLNAQEFLEGGFTVERNHPLFEVPFKGKVLVFTEPRGSGGFVGYGRTRQFGTNPVAFIYRKGNNLTVFAAMNMKVPTVTDFDQDPTAVIETGDFVFVPSITLRIFSTSILQFDLEESFVRECRDNRDKGVFCIGEHVEQDFVVL
jgi:predicted aconitase with swiveling domain